MNKLVFLTLAGLCCLLVAECNEEFHEEWKEFMHNSYCGEASEDQKEHYLKCCDHIPEEMKNMVLEKTEKDNMKEAMDVLCTNEEVAKELCKELQEKKDEMGMNEDVIETLKKCKNNE